MLSKDSKNVIWFDVRQLQRTKLRFKKERHHLYLVLDNCSDKNKDIGLKYGTLVVDI